MNRECERGERVSARKRKREVDRERNEERVGEKRERERNKVLCLMV
jgi:hypothetical protein